MDDKIRNRRVIGLALNILAKKGRGQWVQVKNVF